MSEDGQRAYPEAAEALRHQLYVDDVFFGADSLEEALSRRDQIVKLLASAGMRLGKWAASNPRLVDGLVSESRDAVPLRVDEMVSMLGLKWLPSQDSFTFQFAARPEPVEVTKRSILAAIARTFDPLGWLSPALVTAKILLQDLCLDGVDWDAPIPAVLEQRWKDFTCTLPDVSRVRVKRWLDICEGEEWQLHGFVDASKRAYAAAI
uniref:Reverse transcriptase domain-containing protein n=1 Tax=Trichogramma kaykai TaxID=54128 RepID=A0ABD2WF44_9HYME